jgi:hypothetical protein
VKVTSPLAVIPGRREAPNPESYAVNLWLPGSPFGHPGMKISGSYICGIGITGMTSTASPGKIAKCG